MHAVLNRVPYTNRFKSKHKFKSIKWVQTHEMGFTIGCSLFFSSWHRRRHDKRALTDPHFPFTSALRSLVDGTALP